MSEPREITVTTRVFVPPEHEGKLDGIRVALTHGIADEVNAFFEDEAPGVHVTFCGTEVSA